MSQYDKNYNTTYKVLVLGESGVGKTSIIRRFTDEKYQESYISTIGIDSRAKIITLQDDDPEKEEKVRLQIWDTAGQERFRTLTNAYYRGAMGIILVYDITAEYSFRSINTWLEAIEQNASPNVCRLLVGNKIDTEPEFRLISYSRGKERADESGLKFFETSAKEGKNIDEVFMEMGKLISESKKRKTEQARNSIVINTTQEHKGSVCSC